VAIPRNPGFDVFKVRLLLALDKMLREKRRYQGDLSASINDALLAVNLNTVKLVTLQGKKKQTARETQVVLLRHLIRRLHHVVEARGSSINHLVNSGLMAYYSKQRLSKSEPPSRPTKHSASYDQMSMAERRRLVEALGNLAGLQEDREKRFPTARTTNMTLAQKNRQGCILWETVPCSFSCGQVPARRGNATARTTAR
jgi:hypothetical protein